MALSSAASLSNTFGRPRLFFAQRVTSVVMCRWSSVVLLNSHYKNKRLQRPAVISEKKFNFIFLKYKANEINLTTIIKMS
ncbi:Uncharacterised protein [Enterobacter cloacae]|nr:Uncharacterised protein [Enterobacter cloacae]